MINAQIVLGCVHAPFHNKIAWYKILKLIKDIKPNGINLIGDILDMNSLSFHDRGQFPIIDIQDEYKEIKIFDELDEAIGKRKVEKRFLYGNHEYRYIRHCELPDNKRIIAEAPEDRFRLIERGYELKTNWKNDYFVLGEYLDIFHGELLGVNPAKRQLDKLKKSCMFVHSHRIGVHYDGNMASYNIGGLFDINAPVFNYVGRLIKNNWQNAFAIVHIDDNGYYYATLVPIYNNVFYFNNKKY